MAQFSPILIFGAAAKDLVQVALANQASIPATGGRRSIFFESSTSHAATRKWSAMSEKTLIAWTDHTFNLAWGCVKISPGCKNCYAEADMKSMQEQWREYRDAVYPRDMPAAVFR